MQAAPENAEPAPAPAQESASTSEPAAKPAPAGKTAVPKEAAPKKTAGKASTIAVVLIRGLIGSRTNIRDTLVMLRLRRRNACVLVPNTPAIKGMLKKAKDYITWGEINADTQKKLDSARKKSEGKMPLYHLNSPRKGYGRKGVKVGFTIGGALGNRSEKINDLIERMI